MSPRVGLSDSSISRSSVVLPAPEGPVRNWKLCGAMAKDRSFRTSAPMSYRKPTFSKRTKAFPEPHPNPVPVIARAG